MSDLFNVELEQNLLGCVLLNNDALLRCGELQASHFYDPTHARIFGVAQAKVTDGEVASPVTLRFAMQDDEGIAKLGGVGYLMRLAGAAVQLSAVKDHARGIMELWSRRDLAQALQDASTAVCSSEGGTVPSIASALEDRIAANLAASSAVPMTTTFRRGLIDAVASINSAYMEGTPPGVSTGLKALDGVLGSLRPGWVYVLAGRPSMGKTAIALNIANKAAMRGDPVLMPSLEMPSRDVTIRSISQLMHQRGVLASYRDLMNGKMDEAQARVMIDVAKEYEELPFRFIAREFRELPRLTMALRQAAKHIRPALVVVDYMQLVSVPKARSAFDAVGIVSKTIKSLALEMDCPFLVLSQLNRQVEERDDKRPRLSDLRQSGEIEEDADVILSAYRHEYYLERQSTPSDSKKIGDWYEDKRRAVGKLEIGVLKNRGGPVTTVHAECDLAYNHVGDVDEGQAPEPQDALQFG
jgi:replicative DNA helicase